MDEAPPQNKELTVVGAMFRTLLRLQQSPGEPSDVFDDLNGAQRLND